MAEIRREMITERDVLTTREVETIKRIIGRVSASPMAHLGRDFFIQLMIRRPTLGALKREGIPATSETFPTYAYSNVVVDDTPYIARREVELLKSHGLWGEVEVPNIIRDRFGGQNG